MILGYADPPYPGCAHLYADHPDYAGEVDHRSLVCQMDIAFDGWLLHTSSVALPQMLAMLEKEGIEGYRVMAWVKPFAAFKRNVSVAYAWEPIIIKPCRKPVVTHRVVMRDWIAQREETDLSVLERDFIVESITMKKGLTGVKPKQVCWWAFEMLGMEPDDHLVDLYPGSGAVTAAWNAWRAEIRLGVPE